MQEQFIRTELLIGSEALEKLNKSRIAVFGVGGVGGYVVEALARSGVGRIDLIDDDKVSISNINRQIVATFDTIGKYKVDVMKERILSINPDCIVNTYNKFFLPENACEFPFEEWDYVVDAIDTIAAKIAIIIKCKELNIKSISAMGAGNKFNPQGFKVSDISKTKMDPLSRVIRTELRKRNIKDVKVVYSEEKPIAPKNVVSENNNNETVAHQKRVTPGSNAYVPASCGLLIASEVINDIINN